MRIEEFICVFCNSVLKANIPNDKELLGVSREKESSNFFPYGCPQCGNENHLEYRVINLAPQDFTLKANESKVEELNKIPKRKETLAFI